MTRVVGHGSDRWSCNHVRQKLNEIECLIFQDELTLGLSKIEFESFERGIKRFGHNMDVNDASLTLCVPQTGLDPKKFIENTLLHDYFCHDLVHDHSRYSTRKLLILGFLFCQQTRTEQELALWGIVNPGLKQTIPPSEVRKFLEELTELSTQLPLDHYELVLKTLLIKERNSDTWKIPVKVKTRLEATVEYLKKC